MTLTFHDGSFILSDVLFSKRRELTKDGHWLAIGNLRVSTSNLQAAAAFRHIADDKAEKVFSVSFNRTYDDPSLPPLSYLDPHQLVGVRWILSRRRSYLAHAPGAGKTAQAITASMLTRGPGQTVFIVPPTLTVNWEREVYTFTEKFDPRSWPSIAIVPQSAKQSEMNWAADFIIVPDSMLTRPWVNTALSRMRIKFLAVDEASRFKEATAERSKALFGGVSAKHVYRGLAYKPVHTVLLDGSPMPNRPMELWAPTYSLDPEAVECMNERDFGFKYCGAQMNERGEWQFDHSSNEYELKRRLQERFMHVVPESALSHPERKRSLIFMNEDVRTTEHKTWERKHLSTINFDDLDEDMSQGEMAHFRQELGVRKVPWIDRYVRERLDGKNESVLLFVWHREVALSLHKRLEKYKPGLIIGGVKHDDRERYIREFQAGSSRLIIANIQAAGRGHNLQKADRVVFGEFSWTDELNKQCEKRASRRGRDAADFVRCDYIVCPKSMDEPLLNSIFTKESRVRKVIG